ncbi:MAG: M20/M25/M40 family metallo-hydrolase [Pirellulaceae bacterium]|nr:M20/M25/M40 family metallo-hydrolase [Pirellulaceae bacterium]
MRLAGHAHLGVTFLGLICFAELAIANELTTAFDAINSSDIKIHIDTLADDSFEGREAGTRGGHAAGHYLAQQLERYGLKPAGERGSYYQQFRGNCRNILGMLEGTDPDRKHETIVVGAHYDHVGYGSRKNSLGPIGYIHNGADDNASGVAGVLEVIEGFLALGQPPRRSVLFAFWDGEEQGLWGSKHWAAEPTVPIDRVVMKINADMIGHLRGNQVTIYGTRSSRGLRRLVSQCNTSTDLTLDFTWELKANSDHYSFFDREIPVLMLHTGLNEFYHRPIDDAHRINHDGSQSVARLLFAITHELANQDDLPAFRPSARSERPEHLVELERPAPPRPPRLGVTLATNGSESREIVLSHVYPGLPADRAGLKPGDVLLSFAGQPMSTIESLLAQVVRTESPATVVVRRENEGQLETVELAVPLDGKPLRLGISWREDGAEPGTVVLCEVVANSAAGLAGLQVADRVYQVGGYGFANGDEFRDTVNGWTGPMELLVERQGRLKTVTIDLPSPQM